MLPLPAQEKSLWRESYPSHTLYPVLQDDTSADVVIIGAGITGLTSAYLLAEVGKRVVVLEKDTIAGGTSGRTTGKVTSQHNLNYTQLQKLHGAEAARIYGMANEAAINEIERIIKKGNIDCEWQRCDNYIFTTDKSQIEALKQEADLSASLGLPASFEQNAPLPFPILGAVKFTNQAKMNTQKYLLGLAAAVAQKNGVIHEHSQVRSIRYGPTCTVSTKTATVKSQAIIVATNVPSLPLIARGGYCFLEYPTESYAIAAKLNQTIEGLYISPDKHHHSILPIRIDEQPGALIVGAGGNLAGFRVDKHRRFETLALYAEENLGAYEITNMWSDRDYIAYDHIPLIGDLYPWSKNIYVGTAYKKWGLSNGTVAAMILRDRINGHPNKWSDTFKSIRIKPVMASPKTLFKQFFG